MRKTARRPYHPGQDCGKTTQQHCVEQMTYQHREYIISMQTFRSTFNDMNPRSYFTHNLKILKPITNSQ